MSTGHFLYANQWVCTHCTYMAWVSFNVQVGSLWNTMYIGFIYLFKTLTKDLNVRMCIQVKQSNVPTHLWHLCQAIYHLAYLPPLGSLLWLAHHTPHSSIAVKPHLSVGFIHWCMWYLWNIRQELFSLTIRCVWVLDPRNMYMTAHTRRNTVIINTPICKKDKE